MAKKSKTPTYDLKAADRRRNMLIQVGLTAVVILFAVGLVLMIMKPWEPKAAEDGPPAGEARSISVSAPDKLIKNPDGKPKVVLSMYEDFLCPSCKLFESQNGSTVQQLIDTGAVQADYYFVALQMHDSPQTDFYASRAGGAAYCVADEDPTPTKDAFRRFHAALFAQQPGQTSASFPTNEQLIEMARIAGVASQSLSDCINNGKYTAIVQGMANATDIDATPTIRINGEEFEFRPDTMPQDLINKVTAITGPLPGLSPSAPAPATP